MRILSLLIFLVLMVFFNQKTDSPHGAGFKISCKTCHSPKGWQIDKDIYSFDHKKTRFPLAGQHTVVNCRQCHPTLIFDQAKNECSQCHIDMHQGSVGLDCSRCHTTSSWLVNNISEIHRMSRFPLIGAHRTTDCIQCHKSESLTRFDVPGVNCIDCHRQNYLATTNPNHSAAAFSEDCTTCHKMSTFHWAGAGFKHDIFPLTQGHSVVKCLDCHTSGNFSKMSQECYSCHQQNYTATTNPNHIAAGFPTACETCHSLAPGWKPANIDHSRFPLVLGHSTPVCTDCHKGGNFVSMPADCYSCHQQNYNASTNPNHNATGFAKTCENCHTLNPGWKPANFDHNRFPLKLGHSTPLCIDCHKGGNYTSTSPACYSCHQTDYNSTVNPNHSSLSFSTTCTLCHTTTPGWKPATYTQHDSQFFPIYSGRHRGQWTVCSDCHTNPADYSVFTCITCHNKTNMDSEHRGRSGYSYNSAACLSCHPRGTSK